MKPSLPSAIGELTGGLGSLGLFDIASSILLPEGESLIAHNKQDAWMGHPVQLPPASALMAAQLGGYFFYDKDGKFDPERRDLLIWAMRRQGIAYGTKGFHSDTSDFIEDYKDIWKIMQEAAQLKPGVAEAFKGWIAGALNDNDFDKMMRRNGANDHDWRWLKPFMCQRLTADDAIQLWKRGALDDKAIDEYLKQIQVGMKNDRNWMLELSNQIPPPQDIIRFAVREAFNPEQIKILQLEAELDQNPDYLAWAKASGIGVVSIFDEKGFPHQVDFAKLYWYAHWQLISAGQAYDFYHKFYSKSRYGASPYLQYADKFEADELNAVLKANDYSPAFRKHLAGAAFLPYTRIDVRRIRKENLITKEQVYHNYRASGYDDEHANALTEYIEKDIDNSKNAPVKNGTKTQLCKAFALGSVKIEDVKAGLIAVGFTPNEADGQTGLCEMQTSNAILSSAINSIRGGMLLGAFTTQETIKALEEYQVVRAKIDEYIGLWTLQLDARRKQVSASIVSRWYVDGIIGEEELTSRLFKLNFSELNVSRIVQAAKWEAAKRVARANKVAATEAQRQIEKNLREAEKQRKQADQLARQRKRELDQQQSALLKAEKDRMTRFLSGRTEANLRTWLANEEISEDEVRYTFTIRGWNTEDIERWLEAERRKR